MFLTLEDLNAKIKGSRAPLGAQPIWALFARHVVTNLTTVSNSVRGFTILLLARYLCARLIEENVVARDDALNVFLMVIEHISTALVNVTDYDRTSDLISGSLV